MKKGDINYEYAYMISLSRLEILKVYSPIYDTTFDLLSEEQQKHQLDVWVEDGDKSLQQFNENMGFTTVPSKKENMETFRAFVKKKVGAKDV